MSNIKGINPNFILLKFNSIPKDKDKLIENAIKHTKNTEKKDFYISKLDGSQEDKKNMYSSKCVIFFITNLLYIPFSEWNIIKDIYRKSSVKVDTEVIDSCVENMIFYTKSELIEIQFFLNFILEKYDDEIKQINEQKMIIRESKMYLNDSGFCNNDFEYTYKIVSK